MLIDWLTVNLPYEHISEEQDAVLSTLCDRILKICSKTGEVLFELVSWESVRSDSHQIAAKYTKGGGLWIQGSPARVCGDGCSVFGSGASAALSIGGCIDAMRLFVQQKIGIELPSDISLYRVTRIDVTENLLLPNLTAVHDALDILRGTNGGRYRVDATEGDTVYWSKRSPLRSGKAYAKGPHLEYLKKKKTYTGKAHTVEEIEMCKRLLRLELKLARIFIERNPWPTLTPERLRAEWSDYFMRMIGDSEIKQDNDIRAKLEQIAPTSGRAKAAFSLWCVIQAQGWTRAKEMTPKTSWYRGISLLKQAGLSDSDISHGEIVALRKKIIEAQAVSSWPQLRALCAA